MNDDVQARATSALSLFSSSMWNTLGIMVITQFNYNIV